jgi:hypothetical protein
MHAGCPALASTHVHSAGGKLDIVPAQRHKLAGPQAMAIGDQDSRSVSMAPAVTASSLDKLLDFPLGEVLAGAVTLTLRHCYIYCCWRLLERLLIFHEFLASWQVYCYNRGQNCNSKSKAKGAFAGKFEPLWLGRNVESITQ